MLSRELTYEVRRFISTIKQHDGSMGTRDLARMLLKQIDEELRVNEKDKLSNTTKEVCICTKICDCQNPPLEGSFGKEGGIFHISLRCPEHNVTPFPDTECPATEHTN